VNNSAGPIVTVFRSRLRSEAQAAYLEEAQRMEERAGAAEGLLEFKTFAADDGERVSIIVFDTWEHHQAWRTDRVHQLAQQHGREQFYAGYSIRVCEQTAHRVFPSTSEPGRVRTP
jgi:heme-degrading monooxygenase HmoA